MLKCERKSEERSKEMGISMLIVNKECKEKNFSFLFLFEYLA